MSCSHFRDLAPAYVYDILTAEAKATVAAHLKACAPCAAWLAPVKARLCREVIDGLTDYLGHDLTAEERENLDIHLAVCPECRAYLRSFEATIALGKAAHASTECPPPALPQSLLKAILAARPKKPD